MNARHKAAKLARHRAKLEHEKQLAMDAFERTWLRAVPAEAPLLNSLGHHIECVSTRLAWMARGGRQA